MKELTSNIELNDKKITIQIIWSFLVLYIFLQWIGQVTNNIDTYWGNSFN